MKPVGKVFSKVLKEWLDLYEINGRKVPCVCTNDSKCYIHLLDAK